MLSSVFKFTSFAGKPAHFADAAVASASCLHRIPKYWSRIQKLIRLAAETGTLIIA